MYGFTSQLHDLNMFKYFKIVQLRATATLRALNSHRSLYWIMLKPHIVRVCCSRLRQAFGRHVPYVIRHSKKQFQLQRATKIINLNTRTTLQFMPHVSLQSFKSS